MRYKEFERIISEERMNRYVQACGGNTRKAMTLYRYNVELSQVMFAIICHFETQNNTHQLDLRQGLMGFLLQR